MATHAPAPSRPYRIRRPANEEWWYQHKALQFGIDSSLIVDREDVYIINTPAAQIIDRAAAVDYFHGCIGNRAIAQMADDEEHDVFAEEMISAKRGFVFSCIRKLQRMWRKRRSRRLSDKMHYSILLIVNKWAKCTATQQLRQNKKDSEKIAHGIDDTSW